MNGEKFLTTEGTKEHEERNAGNNSHWDIGMRVLGPLVRFFKRFRLPPAPPGRRWAVFNDGRVAFTYPRHFSQHREPDDTVAVYPPGKDSGITLRLCLHSKMLSSQLDDDAAEQFLSALSEQESLCIQHQGNRQYTSETQMADGPHGEVPVHCWNFAFGKIFIMATATVSGSEQNSEIIQTTLDTVPHIFNSIRRI